MPNTSRCAVVALLLLAGCGSLTKVTVDQSATATIPAATLLEVLTGDIGFGSLVSFDIAQSQEFKNQGIKKEQINSVKVTKLSLTITAPVSGQDFTFLDTLSFFIEAPGVPKKEIAKAGPFAAGTRTVDLTLLDVELAPYATATSMTFTTTASGRRPKLETTITAKVELVADVNLAGVIASGGK